MRSVLLSVGRAALTKTLPVFSQKTFNVPPKLFLQQCPRFSVAFPQHSTLADDNAVSEYLAKHEITVSDPEAPPPVLSFESSGLPEYLLNKILRDFSVPTPIQAQGLPIALSGKNMVGIGQTGSGKTLAFLLPALLHIKKELMQSDKRSKSEGPLAVVLAPTRELAKQIEEVAMEFRKVSGIRTVCCIGGEGRGRQLDMYDRGAELMIATPGRLNDFLEAGDMTIKNAGFIVLDEADRMLDMGFEPQVRSVLSALKDERQTMMFSATWPEEVKDLASEFLGDFTFMNIGSIELSANKNINQHIVVTTPDYKQENFLGDIQDKLANKKVLVFTERKSTVDRLERMMRNRRLSAMGIHGDKSQRMRANTIQRFKDGTCKVMIATDVAARGLDISGVDWVVNYDFPLDIENYIHRIGRTGRANKKGSSLTYMTSDDARFAGKLIKILKDSNQEVSEELIELQRHERSSKQIKGKIGKARDRKPDKRREYGYRGTGRDDGYWDEPYHRERSNFDYGSRRGGYSTRGSRGFSDEHEYYNYRERRRNTDKYGFDE